VKELIGFTDGWSSLYAAALLEDDKLDLLFSELRSTSNFKLTRSVVANIAKGNDPADKNLMFFAISVNESIVKTMTTSQRRVLESKLEEVKCIVNELGNKFTIKDRTSVFDAYFEEETLTSAASIAA
jgi:hypothetical protein